MIMQTSSVAREKEKSALDVHRLNEIFDVYLHYNDRAFQVCRARGISLRDYAVFEKQMNQELDKRLR